jgi:hypothetical protein
VALWSRFVLWLRWLNVTGPSLSDDATLYLTATAPAVDGPYTIAQVDVPMFWNNSADDGGLGARAGGRSTWRDLKPYGCHV